MSIFTSLPKDFPSGAMIARASKKVFIASDHAGYDLKDILKPFLVEHGYDIEDVGPHARDLADDYPDFVLPLARKVAQTPGSRGVVLGGSGQGEAMAANRIRGVRAAAVYSLDEKLIKLTREHNDANVLALGARFLSDDEAKAAVDLWLATAFSSESRHTRRISKLDR